MAQATAVRTLEGIEVPAPGVWEFDVAHSTVGFSVRHLMVTKTRGRFERFGGSIVIGEGPKDSRVEVAIEAASITTGDEKRDGHLRSPDFLDVANYPALRFVGTSVEQTGERTLKIHGDLTIRDVTRPVTLDAEYLGTVADPWGTPHAGFSARTQIDREDFGITWNQALETGGVLVGKKVDIELDVELVRAA